MIRGWIPPLHHLLRDLLRHALDGHLCYVPHMTEHVRNNPWLFPVVLVLAIANIPARFSMSGPGGPSLFVPP